MVDLLAKRKPVGFKVDIFPDFEREKGERAKTVGVAFEISEPVWQGNDPRWSIRPPYLFVPYVLRFGGMCIYCGERIPVGASALYSRKVQGVAHRECHAGFDREVPEGGVP